MLSQLPYIICSGLLVVLNSPTLYWQFRQGNSGPIAMGIWVVLLNFNEFVNYVVWYSDADNRAPIWCDITVKIGLGGQVGRLAAVYCIARFLANIVSPRATAITRQDRHRRALHDYLMSFGVPFLIMACHVVYQSNRFAIQRGRGCLSTQFPSWPTLILRWVWGPVFAVGGMLYSAYTLYRLVRHRRNFSRVVAGAHSALTTARFLRLAALSMSYLCIGVPLTLYSTVLNIASSGDYFDYSWTYFRSTWHAEPVTIIDTPASTDLSSWSNVIVGFIFFAAFSFGTEATEVYKKVMRTCLRRNRSGSSSDEPRGFFQKRGQHEVADNPHAIQIFTRDVKSRPQYTGGVKVIVEEEENIV
ncbi:hypothetical protein JCM8547_001377 [Rhodosporidiobolus lusitaniae]